MSEPRKPTGPRRSSRAGGRRVRDQVVSASSASSALAARSGPLAVVAVVIAVLLVGLAAWHDPQPSDDASAPSPEAVSRIAMVCPAFAERGEPDASTLAVGALAGVGSDGARSAVRVPGDEELGRLTDVVRGAWAQAPSGSGTVAVRLTADGGAAPGTAAFASVSASDERGAGVGVTPCPRPAPQAWFVGAGTTAEHRTALTLTSTTSSPGVVDLTVYGPGGPIDVPSAEGMVVDPGQARVVRLDRLAGGEEDVAVRVDVRRGAVAVSASDVRADGLLAAGSEWLPAAAPPARIQRLVGVPSASTSRTLVVANPTDRSTGVALSFETSDATFTPTGLESLEVAPESVTTLTVPADVSEQAYTVRLESDVPVTAAVRTVVADDHAVTVDPGRWSGTAVVPMDLGDVDAPSILMLTPDGDEAVTATVVAHADDGAELGRAEVTAEAGRTTSFALTARNLSTSDKAAAYLTVDSGGESLRASAVVDSGGLAELPLTAAPVREPAPVVRAGP